VRVYHHWVDRDTGEQALFSEDEPLVEVEWVLKHLVGAVKLGAFELDLQVRAAWLNDPFACLKATVPEA